MSELIHNIGVLAHVDSGKTTLTEQLLYLMGAIRRIGSVDDGTTATDNLDIEKQRGISVRASAASAFWQGIKFNFIDTPGHVDFAGEVERALFALDYAIVVVSAVEGVKAHTESILMSLESAHLPKIVFINKIDRAGADVGSVLNELKKLTNQSFFLISDVNNQGGEKATTDIVADEIFSIRATEVLSDIYDDVAELFLTDGILEKDTALHLLRSAVSDCKVIPVICGSAKFSLGVKDLADTLVQIMPSAERRSCDELSGVIFKIDHDKTLGKLSYVRLFGGEIYNRDEVKIIVPKGDIITDSETFGFENENFLSEKVSQIKTFNGARLSDSGFASKGDIAVLSGMPSAKTGNFLGTMGVSENIKMVNPFLRVKVSPDDNDLIKIPQLAQALKELSDEEPYIDARWENGQKEITINTTGKIQLEVIDNLLQERYNLKANFSPPTVIYKETPSTSGIAHASYTMPKPCWAVVDFMIEPMPRGYGVSYHGRLPSNQCFYRYQSHIKTSFESCLKEGLYGWEVTDFKCTLVGGEHHTIHTHPLDFFVCTPMAFMNGLSQLGSTILEPLLKVRISVPSDVLGRVLSEIVKIGGEYDSPVALGDVTVIEAVVSVAASMDLPTRLAIISSGRAVLTQSFYGYKECTDGLEHINPRHGVNPLERSKWILWARGAYNAE